MNLDYITDNYFNLNLAFLVDESESSTCYNCVKNLFYYYHEEAKLSKKNIPRLIQRANDIVVACRYDKDELTEEGLSWEVVKELAEMVPQVSDTDVQYRLEKEILTLGKYCLIHQNS